MEPEEEKREREKDELALRTALIVAVFGIAIILYGIFLGTGTTVVWKNLPRPETDANVTRQQSQAGEGTGENSSADLPLVRQPISLNSASAAQLEELPGIGPVLAQRIVDYRQTHGLFSSLEDLTQVDGIGEGILNSVREYLTL